MDQYDVVVIGGGPGGYIAAIRAAQLGLKTACVDATVGKSGEPALGGTCLNVGCIPSKALLDSSHHYHSITHEFGRHGIRCQGVKLDLAQMLARKDEVIRDLTDGVAMLFAKHKIAWLAGKGSLAGERRVDVARHDGGRQTIAGRHIIIATGSAPVSLAAAPCDGERIVDSTGALDFPEVPRRLAVIGAGVVALELGSVWSRLGAEVEVFVRGDRLLPKAERQLAHELQKQLEAQALRLRFNSRPIAARVTKRQVTLTYLDAEGQHAEKYDRVLVATGRRPFTEGLSTQEAGLVLDDRGFIQVDEQCRTNVPGIWAIGDVVRGPMLAHKASEEGAAVAERIAGLPAHVNYATIPWVIYTWPEFAWVGETSEQLTPRGVEFRHGVFPFTASGRARAAGDTAGMVKVLADARTDRLLGVHILGPQASELISEAVVAMEFAGSAEDLARTIHAHPTLSEAVHEAALAADRRAWHR